MNIKIVSISNKEEERKLFFRVFDRVIFVMERWKIYKKGKKRKGKPFIEIIIQTQKTFKKMIQNFFYFGVFFVTLAQRKLNS